MRTAPILSGLQTYKHKDFVNHNGRSRRCEKLHLAISSETLKVLSAPTASELEFPIYAYASYASFSASWFSSPCVFWPCDSPLFSLSLIRVKPTDKRSQFQNGAPTYCGPTRKTAVIANAAIAAAIKIKSKRSNSPFSG